MSIKYDQLTKKKSFISELIKDFYKAFINARMSDKYFIYNSLGTFQLRF